MNKIFIRRVFLFTFFMACGIYACAQSITVSGIVVDKFTKAPIPDVSITIKGKSVGSATDVNGKFSFTTTEKMPFTLYVSCVGFSSFERQISSTAVNLNFELESVTMLGQEVVISASRTPERILESPVSIERIGAASIKEISAPSFYDALNNMKGVEMSVQSLTFKSVNTRGFNSNGNTRFNQFVDGMDNQAPGLNFSVGNLVGLSELDVDNLELLPGAASALYGAGGTNGTLLMSSKNPFQYPGISFQYKGGINHVDDVNSSKGVKEFRQFDVRIAKSWDNRFGFKTTFSYLQAKDWIAANYENYDRTSRTGKSGDRNSDPNYNGVNIYGDEVSQNMAGIAQTVNRKTIDGIKAASKGAIPDIQKQLDGIFKNNLGVADGVAPTDQQQLAALGAFPEALRPFVQNYLPVYVGLRAGLIPANQFVSRTGYDEKDLLDYNTKSLKAMASLHYKFNNTIEAIAQANWGTGTSVYTGSDRYSLRDFNIGQYKLELKGQDFFLKAYTTQERSGKSYNATLLGTFINEAWKPSTSWFPQYIAAYSKAKQGGISDGQAHAAARSYADQGRAMPGSSQFAEAKNEITQRFIGPENGARFNDKSNLYHYEGMYNFSNAFNNVVEFLMGTSFRNFYLHSDGTIFDDATRNIVINEYGAYGQLGKKFGEYFKATVAGRYDKSKNFKGRLTPRLTFVYTVAPNNNIRASFQTGYSNPTTQEQYIDFSVAGGTTRLIGGLPEILTKYNLYTNLAYTASSFREFIASVIAGAPNPALLQPYKFDASGLRPEKVKSFELGYKGLITKNLLIDVYGYYNIYNDFIGGIELHQNTGTATTPVYTKYSVSTNVNNQVTSFGGALGADYQAGKFNFNGNVSYNKLGELPANVENTFNTPQWRLNLGFGSREIIKNIGFNVQYRWQDQFVWNSTFGVGKIPAYSTFDAQVNLKVPLYKSIIKLGGSNILNKYYTSSFGNPQVGAIYYLSYTFEL